jgi:type I restriction enzyme R subunit/putative DNA methylase
MILRTKREYLRQLVDAKNRWSRPLTDEEKALEFLGWHERGYLPHCDFPGLVQFVTYRLEDSMPASRRSEWEHLLAIEDVREKRTKLEDYLDRGLGDCYLRDPQIAQLAEDALLHFHEQRCEMLAWCVMPNHVHVLVHVWQTPLWKLVKSWKVHVALRAKSLLPERRILIRPEGDHTARTPNWNSALQHGFWQREYWDTFMRDEEQERKAIRYIENNPVKAKLCRVAEDWPFSSARIRDAFRRLDLSPRTFASQNAVADTDARPAGPAA